MSRINLKKWKIFLLNVNVIHKYISKLHLLLKQQERSMSKKI